MSTHDRRSKDLAAICCAVGPQCMQPSQRLWTVQSPSVPLEPKSCLQTSMSSRWLPCSRPHLRVRATESPDVQFCLLLWASLNSWLCQYTRQTAWQWHSALMRLIAQDSTPLCHFYTTHLAPMQANLCSLFHSCPECHLLGRVWQLTSYVSTGIATAQWLGLRLQLIAAVLVTLVGVMAIAGNEDILPGFHGAGEYTASKVAMP